MLECLVVSRSFENLVLFSLLFSVWGQGLTGILHRAIIVGVSFGLIGLRASRGNATRESLVP